MGSKRPRRQKATPAAVEAGHVSNRGFGGVALTPRGRARDARAVSRSRQRRTVVYVRTVYSQASLLSVPNVADGEKARLAAACGTRADSSSRRGRRAERRAKSLSFPFARVYAYTHIQVTQSAPTSSRLTAINHLRGGSLRGAHPNSPSSRVASPAKKKWRDAADALFAIRPPRSTARRRAANLLQKNSRKSSFTFPSRSRGRSWTRSRSTACRRRWPRPRAPPGCRGPRGGAR